MGDWAMLLAANVVSKRSNPAAADEEESKEESVRE
jgi:hypothetical protein